MSISIRVITRCFFFQRYILENLTGCGSISNVSLGYLWCNSQYNTFPTVKWCHTLLSQRLYVPNAVLNSIRNQKNKPSLENTSATPMSPINLVLCRSTFLSFRIIALNQSLIVILPEVIIFPHFKKPTQQLPSSPGLLNSYLGKRSKRKMNF